MFLVFDSLAWNCFHENFAQVSECGDSSPTPRSQQSLLDHTAKKSDTYEECYHSKKDVLGPPPKFESMNRALDGIGFLFHLGFLWSICEDFIVESIGPCAKTSSQLPENDTGLTGPLIFRLVPWFSANSPSEDIRHQRLLKHCRRW